MPAASAIPSATSSSSSFSIVKPELQQKQFQECTMAHFNRAQFFFDPPHIQQQARIDRRFLQRLYREKSHATVHNFFPIDCDEEELPKQFQELYKKLNGAETDSTRVYQLIINTLTYYYSRLTWSTSVQKCVFTFLDQHLLKSFHSNLEARSQFELEMCCLIELFMLRYGADTANENTIYDILHQIRSKFGLINLSAFVHNIIINHFGYSLEPKLRSIFDRLDFKVKSYRSEPLFASGGSMPSSANKRKCSLTSLVSQEGASSEPTHSSSEEAQMGGKDNGGGGDDDSSDENPIMPMEQDEQLEEEEEAIEEAEEQEKSPPVPKVARRAGKAIKSHSPAIEINGISPLVTKRSHKAGASTAAAVKKNPASRSSPRGRATPIAKNPAKKNTKPTARTPVSSQAKKRRSSAGSQSTAMANAGTGASTTMTGTRVSARQLLVVRVHDVNKAASSIALLMSPELLARYRRRMNAAKRQKGSADEIFYGRASMRRGLFERSSTSPADLVAFNTRNSLYKTTTTINDNNKQQQKSRSGRVIKSPTMAADDCVHIAHTLLNIHNKDPLSPPAKKKKGKTAASPMVAPTEEAASVDAGGGMLRKLLKPAGRSARKKMEKLLRNNNKQQQQKRVNSAASNKLETSNGA